MKVGDKEVRWDFGWEAASELLTAIQMVATTSMNRVDGPDFKVYKVGSTGCVVRIDLAEGFVTDA